MSKCRRPLAFVALAFFSLAAVTQAVGQPPFQTIEGQSFTMVVGNVDAQSAPTIDWGDGTPSSSSSYNPRTRDVTGTHTYAEEGTYTGTIYYLNSDSSPSTQPFTVTVQDAPLSVTGTTPVATAGTSFTAQVASFTDADPGGTASDYTATIDWGDRTVPSPGLLSASGSGFKVSGTHAYASSGSYTIRVTVLDAGGSSAAATSTASVNTSPIPPPPTPPPPGTPPPGTPTLPVVVARVPVVGSSTGARFSGTVNPSGLSTTAYFEYGLDPSLRATAGAAIALSRRATPGAAPDLSRRATPAALYDQRTPTQNVAADTVPHQVSARVSGLLPNARYHVRLVASNAAGTVYGPDQPFKTAQDPAPPLPTLGRTFDSYPVSGIVFIKPPPGKTLGVSAIAATLTKGKGFVPLTEARLIPAGSQIDARRGTLRLLAATGAHHSTRKDGVFGGALFKATQASAGITKGLTTLTLLENLFPGAPSYNSCKITKATAGPLSALTAASQPSVLQTLHARAHNRKFRTRGAYSAGTVRGTIWDTTDECAGTLTTVRRGTVDVYDFGRRKTITVHAGHHYLAQATRK